MMWVIISPGPKNCNTAKYQTQIPCLEFSDYCAEFCCKTDVVVINRS